MTFFWDDEDDFQLFDKQGVVVEQIVSFIDEAVSGLGSNDAK